MFDRCAVLFTVSLTSAARACGSIKVGEGFRVKVDDDDDDLTTKGRCRTRKGPSRGMCAVEVVRGR